MYGRRRMLLNAAQIQRHRTNAKTRRAVDSRADIMICASPASKGSGRKSTVGTDSAICVGEVNPGAWNSDPPCPVWTLTLPRASRTPAKDVNPPSTSTPLRPRNVEVCWSRNAAITSTAAIAASLATGASDPECGRRLLDDEGAHQCDRCDGSVVRSNRRRAQQAHEKRDEGDDAGPREQRRGAVARHPQGEDQPRLLPDARRPVDERRQEEQERRVRPATTLRNRQSEGAIEPEQPPEGEPREHQESREDRRPEERVDPRRDPGDEGLRCFDGGRDIHVSARPTIHQGDRVAVVLERVTLCCHRAPRRCVLGDAARELHHECPAQQGEHASIAFTHRLPAERRDRIATTRSERGAIPPRCRTCSSPSG